MVEVNGFLDEIKSALFHGGDGFFDGTESGEKNDGDGGIGLLGFTQNVEAGGAGHF